MSGSNFVPFQAGRADPFVAALPTHVYPAQPISGHGSPEGTVPGNPGQRYQDLDNGDQWMKIQGTSALGWQKVGTTGTAGVQIIG